MIGNFVISLNPLLVVDEPVVEELFLGFLQVIQISVKSNISRTLSEKERGDLSRLSLLLST